MDKKKADFILKGDEVIYPEVVKNGLEVYYSTRAKKNDDTLRNTIIDMSGNKRHATLTGFDFKGVTGFHDGLVFDGRDDTLTRPGVAGLSPDDLTFQMNGNILRFKADGTSQRVEDRTMVDVGRNLLLNTDFDGIAKRYNKPAGGTTEGGFRFTPTVQVESDIPYTLSLKIRGKGNLNLYQINTGGNLAKTLASRGNLSETDYKLVTLTFTVPIARTLDQIFICTAYGATVDGDWFEIEPNSLKLERGSFATPWTPAPEDLISNLSYKGNILGDLESTIDDVDVDRVTNMQVMIKGNKKNPIDVTVEGNTVQHSDWYTKEGLSTQYQDTKVMGKNLIKSTGDDWEIGSVNGTPTSGADYPQSETYRSMYIPVRTGAYTLSIFSNLSIETWVHGYNEDKTGNSVVLSWTRMASGKVFTITDQKYIRILVRPDPRELADLKKIGNEIRIQLEEGSVATPYEPYKDSVKNGLVLEYNGANFFNSPQTTSLKDRSGNGNHGTPSGFSYTTASGSDGNGGIAFDGVDDYVRMPRDIVAVSRIRTHGVTYSAWVYMSEVRANSNIIAQSPSVGYSGVASGGIVIRNGKVSMSCYDDGASYKYSESVTRLSLNTWYHLTGVYDSIDKVIKVYVNGVLSSTPVSIGTFNRLIANEQNNIGCKYPGVDLFKGKISYAAIYNRALSDAEIYQNYMAGVNLNMPAPTDPSPVVSNLPAGTYKYTSTDGIYEFTLDEDLCGLGVNVDKVVFDRVSKTGKLERKVVKKVLDGNEPFQWSCKLNAASTALCFYVTKIVMPSISNSLVTCTHAKYNISGAYTTRPINTVSGYADSSASIMFVMDKTLFSTYNNAGVKEYLSNQYAAGTPVTIVYQESLDVVKSPLTFTKVASSTKTEVPMTFFTATPSLEYPAQVWDGGGNVVSRGKNLFDQNRSIELFGQNASAGYGSSLCTKILRGYQIRKRWSAFGFWHHLTPNTEYTLSAKVSFSITDSGQKVGIVVNGYLYSPYSEKYSRLFDGSDVNGTRISLTFISSATGAINNIGFMSNSSDSTTDWTVDITDICLQLGGSSVYDEYVAEQYTLPTLRKIGTVADTYNPTTGEYVKRISDWVTLDGAKSWLFHGADSLRGSKLFYIGLLGGVNGKSLTFDYQTKPLSNSGNVLANENVAVLSTQYNVLYVRPTNTDTGFSDALSPSGPEVKAYFYGWKMANADGTSPYYKSEVPYTPSTWAEWGKSGGITQFNSSGLKIPLDNGNQYIIMSTSLKNSTNYGMIYNIVENVGTSGAIYIPINEVSSTNLLITKPGEKGHQKRTFTTIASITGNRLQIKRHSNEPNSYAVLKDIRVFELPPGSQIEDDFTYLTADQLAAKYTFNGLCQKHWKKITDGTGLTNVLPTKSYEGYTPYKMIYQLEDPVVTYLDPVVPPIYYPTTVIETDSPDYCKPMLNTVVKAVDYLKENRTINNVLLWSRSLTDSEMKRQYRLSHERFAMKSTSLKRDPIEMYVNLTSGASTGTTLSTDITLTI